MSSAPVTPEDLPGGFRRSPAAPQDGCPPHAAPRRGRARGRPRRAGRDHALPVRRQRVPVAHVRQADKGCDFDFLEGTAPVPEPEIH